MKNKICYALAVLALTAAASANALPTPFKEWGTVTPEATQSDGHEFHFKNDFTDVYTFTLTADAILSGTLVAFEDEHLKIKLSSVSVYKGDSLLGSDDSPFAFSFENLGAGIAYSLVISGNTAFDGGGKGPALAEVLETAGYKVNATFSAVPHAVSEPGSIALTGLGLLGLALVMRRRLFS